MFGTVAPTRSDGKLAITSYNLDNAAAVTVQSPSTPVVIYDYQFYNASSLNDGDHTLIVTGVAVDSETEFWFDYLEYGLGSQY